LDEVAIELRYAALDPVLDERGRRFAFQLLHPSPIGSVRNFVLRAIRLA
jgi:hypothetical protein